MRRSNAYPSCSNISASAQMKSDLGHICERFWQKSGLISGFDRYILFNPLILKDISWSASGKISAHFFDDFLKFIETPHEEVV